MGLGLGCVCPELAQVLLSAAEKASHSSSQLAGWMDTHIFGPRAKCCNIETSKIESMKINLEPP